MNYKYCYFESVLSNKFINQINKLAKLEKKNLGKVTKESIEDKKMSQRTNFALMA